MSGSRIVAEMESKTKHLRRENTSRRRTDTLTGRRTKGSQGGVEWDRGGRGEQNTGMLPTLQNGHLLFHSRANNGQSGVGFRMNKK